MKSRSSTMALAFLAIRSGLGFSVKEQKKTKQKF